MQQTHNLTFTHPITIVIDQGDKQQFDQVKALLHMIIDQGRHLLMTQEEALLVIQQINTATNEQGVVLAAEGASLQTISDGVDALLAKANATGMTPEIAQGLTDLVSKTSEIGTSLAAHAAFSTAIAAKASSPVPVEVPPVTPPVA